MRGQLREKNTVITVRKKYKTLDQDKKQVSFKIEKYKAKGKDAIFKTEKYKKILITLIYEEL